MKKPEILAPAGNFEKMRTAVHYGADAVYLGDSRFSLRGKAGNFAPGELRSAVEYAHRRGVRAYVTVNIFPHNADLPEIQEHLEFLADIGPDAVILSDPGIFRMCRERAPRIPIHISTQANITNSASARFWEDMGAKRLVLARELSVGEMRQIRDETSLELEAFVHGSLCISYSGRCYISSFLASRGANTGECTNSCRWNYTLMEEKRQGEYFPVFEDDRGTYVMSSKDLCMVDHLALLAEAGIDSFKIEGRMKGINYVAGVVKTYREAVDALQEGAPADHLRRRWHNELSMFSSRGYTTGMYLGRQADDAYNFDGESYRMSHDLVGVILSLEGGLAKIGLRNRLDVGDIITYLTPGLEEETFRIDFLRDENSLPVLSARNEDIVFAEAPPEARELDLIRRARGSRQTETRDVRVAGSGV